jgi:hypothetical protein
MGGTVKDRTQQKELCPSISGSMDGCTSVFNTTEIKFFNMQFIDGLDYTNRGGFNHFMFDDAGLKEIVVSNGPPIPTHKDAREKFHEKPWPKIIMDDKMNPQERTAYLNRISYNNPRRFMNLHITSDICSHMEPKD